LTDRRLSNARVSTGSTTGNQEAEQIAGTLSTSGWLGQIDDSQAGDLGVSLWKPMTVTTSQ
jgi:hypothetical protein